jgi:hypothetical protein
MTPEEQIQVNNIQKQSGGATNFKLETCDMCRMKQDDPTL